MGILDKKSRIAHIRLTETGRDLLSRNQFDITYYKFFDDGIDYDLDEEAIINDTLVPESISDAKRECKRSLSTIDAIDPHVKPYMYISKNNVTLRKRQQEGAMGTINLAGAIDVLVEGDEPQYETAEPIYSPSNEGEYVPLIAYTPSLTLESSALINSEDTLETEERLDTELEFGDSVDLQSVKMISVLSISAAEKIDLKLIGANIHNGFRVEVFYSGSIDTVPGSENLIKLTECAVDSAYKSYYGSDDFMPIDILAGYGNWFRIVPQ